MTYAVQAIREFIFDGNALGGQGIRHHAFNRDPENQSGYSLLPQ